jgi:hypothetical protein
VSYADPGDDAVETERIDMTRISGWASRWLGRRVGIGLALLVMVALAASPVMASSTTVAWDEFNHDASSGWGNAHIGGHWDKHGSGLLFLNSLAGEAEMDTYAGHATGAILSGDSAANVDIRVSMYVRHHELYVPGPLYAYVVARNSGNGELRAKLTFNNDCSVWVNGSVVTGGKERAISSPVRTTAIWCDGPESWRTVLIRAQVSGSDPTTIKIKAWNGAAEPSAWQWTGSTRNALLADAMHVGVRSYVSSLSSGTRVAGFFFRSFSAKKI